MLEDLRALFCITGKVPLVTADVPCFMLDRVFDNWCNEAAHLLDRASAAEIDSTAAEFVHAGPFFVLNLAHGNPIIIETNTLQADEEGEHYRPAAIFRTAGTWTTVSPGKTVPVAPETAAAHPRPPARHLDFAERRYSRSQHRRRGGPRARLPPGARLQIRAARIDGPARRRGNEPHRQAPRRRAAGPAAAATSACANTRTFCASCWSTTCAA